jgi:AraC-like DNA-binding protein
MFATPIDFYGLFAFLSMFFCVVILIVFVLHNDWSRLFNRMLLFTLISFAATSLQIFLLQTEVASSFPAIVKAGQVFFFLIMPFSYLYIHKLNLGSWKKFDFLHFIPALIFLLQFLPIFALAEETTMDESMAGSSRAITAINFYSRSFQWLAYCVAMIIIYRKINTKSSDGPLSRKMMIWLSFFIGVLTITAVVPLIARIQGMVENDNFFFLFTSGSAFLICLSMLINPEVLYGIPPKTLEITSLNQYLQETQAQEMDEIRPEDVPQLKPKKLSLTEAQVEYMHKKLHEFMFIRKPFLHQKYTLQQLSSDSGFPLYQLSLYLNRTLGMNFNSYINKMRIEFLLESYKHNKEKWNKFTLEAIAREIGFNNRTSFIQAFKKVTGSNPSVYFKNMHGHVISE